MDSSVWLPLQALGTLVVVIVLAFLSYRWTRKRRAEQDHLPASALARKEPDPQFQPDADETDPFHVTDAHPDEPDHRTDVEPRHVGADPQPGERRAVKTHPSS